MRRVSPAGHEFEVRDGVYEPAEDSWLLARVLADLADLQGARAADVGSGAGVQAVTLASLGAHVAAVDVNPRAAALTRANAAANGLAHRVDALRGRLLDPLADGCLDVVACNPPYLPESGALEGWEAAALEAGEAGVGVALGLAADLDRVLAPGGEAYLVASTRGDVDALEAGIREAGLAGEVVAEEAFPHERLRVHRLQRR